MEIFILAASYFEFSPWAGLHGWTASPYCAVAIGKEGAAMGDS